MGDFRKHHQQKSFSEAFTDERIYDTTLSPNVTFLTVKEAAELLKVSEGCVYRHYREGTIPGHKRLGRVYFIREELVEWVRSG